MALQAITNFNTVDFVTIADRDSDNKTIFKIKPLNGMQAMEVMHNLLRDEYGNFKVSAAGLKLALQYGLEGWDNLLDEQGNRIPFAKANVNKVPSNVLIEIASEIINRSIH
jgi:hypothetical protein